MGVTCETMSLQLLTAQTRLVEALAGMYMKSTVFRADEGLGELSLPGAPQVRLCSDCLCAPPRGQDAKLIACLFFLGRKEGAVDACVVQCNAVGVVVCCLSLRCYLSQATFCTKALSELIPSREQAFLPVERALYAAGMRDGDVVTLVDGLPATQETLAALGEKAHTKCVSFGVSVRGGS